MGIFDADTKTIYTRDHGVVVVKTIRPRWFGRVPMPNQTKELETYFAIRDFALTNYVGPVERIEVNWGGEDSRVHPHGQVVVVMRCVPRDAHESARSGVDADGMISVVSGAFHFEMIDPGSALRAIREAIRTVVLHEIDEGLMLGGTRPWDPHRPSGLLERDGLP